MIQRVKQYANEQRYNAVYAWRRALYRSHLPRVGTEDARIVADLQALGGHVTSLDALGIRGTAEMLEAADAAFDSIADRSPPEGDFVVHPADDAIERRPALIRWGLDPRLLAIVTRYIGLPVVYRGLTVRRDIAGGAKKDTRLFHRDNEDNRIVKVIVYLNDVDETGGPYEFVSKSLAPSSWRIHTEGSRAEDAAVAAFVPADKWTTCTGRRGTVVFTDTCRVFHRGRVASSADRKALFFCYNSVQPMSPQWCAPLFDHAAFRNTNSDLTDAQRAAITAPYAVVAD